VVGPNGSGKSNLMESLLFVFGKRAKRMRLNKLNELIHNSSNMNNLKFARVTLFFKEVRDLENEEVEEIPNSSFNMSREVYKNGSSKYLLNGKEIGFDNLCNILISKGIDLKHNRFLILQGEVEQISMMKPKAATSGEVGLLEFLEDIIGTNRYVSLIEKLSKDIDEMLEIKTQKMNRVKITKNELDQLEDVKNSGTEYYKKEKELHIFGHLDFLIKRHQINKQILDCQEQIKKLESELQAIDKKIIDKINENSVIIDEHKRIRAEQENIKQKKQELNKQADALEEIDKVKRSDIENYSKNIGKAKTALEKLIKNYQNQSELIKNSANDLPKKEKELETLSESRKRLEKYINEKEQEIFEKTGKIQVKKRELERELQPFLDKIANNTFQIDQNTSTINLVDQKFAKIKEDFTKLTEKKQEMDKQRNEKKDLLDSIKTKVLRIEDGYKESKEVLKKANEELDQKYKITQNLQIKISEYKNAAQEKSQRSNILEALLKAQQEGRLSGIYGRLGDLGVIDAKYDIAITTACPNLDSIVVETVDHAQKCLDFLKKGNIGRATFLILEKIAWIESKMKENFRTPNNTERLFDLVKNKNQRLAIAFYFALKNTLVAPDLKTATSVAYGTVRNRVVTLSGEMIEISGTMSGGGKPKKGGMSNKESLIEEFSQDYLERMNNEYQNMIKEFEACRTERNGLELRVNNLNAQLQEFLILKSKTENELIALENSYKENVKALSLAEKEYEKFDNQNIEQLRTTNEEFKKKNESLNLECSDLRNDLSAIETELGKISGEEFNQKKEEFKGMKKRIETLEKEINTMKHTCENAPEILKKIEEEMKMKEATIKDYEEAIEKIKKELEDLEKQAMEYYGQIEVLTKEAEDLDKAFTTKTKEVEELKVMIRKMKDEQEKFKGEMAEINAEIKKLEKSEKLIQDDLNKNKKSYKKLVEEFGFIDDFDKEINSINKGSNKIINDEMAMDIEEEKKEEIEEIEVVHKPSRLRKTNLNYQKFIDPKYIDYNFKFEELDELATNLKEIAYEYTMLQTKINDMKPNMNAIMQYKNKLIELKGREEDLNMTIEKLNKAKTIFDRVKTSRYNEFMEGFNIISSKLKEMYQLITNGGDAELELLDSLDPFSEGILFSVRPFKKSWKQISNLSGGEKTLSSLSLIFALHHYKPSPLYVLDEIDAALDFKNVSIIANYIKVSP
jgi:structural maintenance of chromosome 4